MRTYYTTPAWYRRCDAVCRRARGRCEFCRHRAMQQTHHRTYDHFRREPLADLMGVCDLCHRAIHGLLRRGRVLTCEEDSLLAQGDRGMGDSPAWRAYLRTCKEKRYAAAASSA
jgi:hypothetical protein